MLLIQTVCHWHWTFIASKRRCKYCVADLWHISHCIMIRILCIMYRTMWYVSWCTSVLVYHSSTTYYNISIFFTVSKLLLLIGKLTSPDDLASKGKTVPC